MNRETIGTIAVAVCCLFAIASSAATLDASVDTEPDDVINMDTVSLPIESDTAEELREDIDGEGDTSDDEETEAAADEPGDHESSDAGDDERGDEERSSDEGQDDEDGGSERDTRGQDDGTDDGGSTFGYGSGGMPDGLWASLWALLDALLSLLPFLVLLAAIAVAVAYRDRLRALLGRSDDGRDERDGSADGTVRRPAPSNDVERAWFSLVRPFGADDETKTPREYATDAIESGADSDAVSSLTRNFEAVRYGGEPVTGRRTSRAWRDLERAIGRDGEHS